MVKDNVKHRQIGKCKLKSKQWYKFRVKEEKMEQETKTEGIESNTGETKH